MDWGFLEDLRKAEGDLALAKLGNLKPPPASLVEIGGGSGWQAQQFVAAGYDVQSFDLAGSSYSGNRVFPVRDYDGHRLPLADASTDVVFSSNVLEHIAHVREFQGELLRILKPDGIALHLLPTSTWRLWTTVLHYPGMAKLASGARQGARKDENQAGAKAGSARPSNAAMLARHLVPRRHGEIGNAMSELYYFSGRRWKRLFEDTGWAVTQHDTNKLAYTGFSLLGGALGLDARRRLSKVLGSSCHVFVLRKLESKTRI